jgi:hypothetical protein
METVFNFEKKPVYLFQKKELFLSRILSTREWTSAYDLRMFHVIVTDKVYS